ncbi:penicillin-binding protein 2 [Patescibacteria group bacterium]|nr:penicillin-binding protein 2 [Patescibacteria group bacterium]HPD08052.1 penicillin-binding protein 2 [bacterium]
MAKKGQQIKNLNSPFGLVSEKKRQTHLSSGHKEWTEEVFLNEAKAEETVSHNFNPHFGLILLRILLLAGLILLARVVWLQFYRGDYYYNLAEGNRLRTERLEAKRGIIYDTHHEPLVSNMANFIAYVTPSNLPTDAGLRQAVLAQLSLILGESAITSLKEELAVIDPGSADFYQPVVISDNLTYNEVVQLTIKLHRLPGVSLATTNKRLYANLSNWLATTSSTLSLNSLSLILGYTGKISPTELEKYKESGYSPLDYIGKVSLEAYYETDLRGTNGSKQVEVDALGNEKAIISQQNPIDGRHLVLNIDARLQAKLEEIMRQHLARIGGRRAAAIVINPQNGAILAMVSQPSFDNNSFSLGIKQADYDALKNDPDTPLLNRAISGEYPSGSTIKPIIAAAALEEKIITPSTSFLSTGGLRVGQWFFPDWKAGGHGWTNVTKAIAESVNTFFYYIGGGYEDFTGLGVERLGQYLQSFGLGRPTGIDLTGETSGFVPTAEWKEQTTGEPWYIGDTYHLAIGQGYLLVTPLQVANYTTAFANGGRIYQPRVVQEILNNDGSIYEVKEPKIIAENMVSPENIETVRQAMRQTVVSGSAQSLKSLPVAVAGKTGTAQFDSRKPSHSWFTGFAPFDNPQMVLTVLVEEGGESTDSAVPIAKDFWQWYFSSLDTSGG